ncbi:hypothetical protein DL93DRAFT_2073489 [Clavulina sp. PMI_390]|nr:hypothetical protein DL93DRAFT_2073489 [Clavulina sp. PMI_390]
MATTYAKEKLAQCENIAQAVGANQPELGIPCLDLVTVFEELKATDGEADALYEDLRSLQREVESIDRPPISALGPLTGTITSLFEDLAAYRIKKSFRDEIALRMGFNTRWVVERVRVLDTAHIAFQRAVEEYERDAKEHTARVQRAMGH